MVRSWSIIVAVLIGSIFPSFVPKALGQSSIKQERVWEKITPAVSTRQEIQEKLGESSFETSAVSIYKLPVGRLAISFFDEKPIPAKGCTWEAMPGVVYRYSLSLAQPIPLSAFKHERKQYEVIPGDDGRRQYTDERSGESFATEGSGESELVVLIARDPSLEGRRKFCH